MARQSFLCGVVRRSSLEPGRDQLLMHPAQNAATREAWRRRLNRACLINFLQFEPRFFSYWGYRTIGKTDLPFHGNLEALQASLTQKRITGMTPNVTTTKLRLRAESPEDLRNSKKRSSQGLANFEKRIIHKTSNERRVTLEKLIVSRRDGLAKR